MKTIKVIDLLNKIANGEEVPEKIKYDGFTYIKNNDDDLDFYVRKNGCVLLLDEINDTNELLDEVEIIEEEQDIEEIPIKLVEETSHFELKEKINELIKAVNELKKNER